MRKRFGDEKGRKPGIVAPLIDDVKTIASDQSYELYYGKKDASELIGFDYNGQRIVDPWRRPDGFGGQMTETAIGKFGKETFDRFVKDIAAKHGLEMPHIDVDYKVFPDEQLALLQEHAKDMHDGKSYYGVSNPWEDESGSKKLTTSEGIREYGERDFMYIVSDIIQRYNIPCIQVTSLLVPIEELLKAHNTRLYAAYKDAKLSKKAIKVIEEKQETLRREWTTCPKHYTHYGLKKKEQTGEQFWEEYGHLDGWTARARIDLCYSICYPALYEGNYWERNWHGEPELDFSGLCPNGFRILPFIHEDGTVDIIKGKQTGDFSEEEVICYFGVDPVAIVNNKPLIYKNTISFNRKHHLGLHHLLGCLEEALFYEDFSRTQFQTENNLHQWSPDEAYYEMNFALAIYMLATEKTPNNALIRNFSPLRIRGADTEAEIVSINKDGTIDVQYKDNGHDASEFWDDTIYKNQSLIDFLLEKNPKEQIIASFVGSTITDAEGNEATITDFVGPQDVTIQYEDGLCMEHLSIDRVQDHRFSRTNEAVNRLGMTFKDRASHYSVEVVGYRNESDVDYKVGSRIYEHLSWDWFECSASDWAFAMLDNIGAENRSKDGVDMKIVGFDVKRYYEEGEGFKILFADGVIVYGAYSDFKRGRIPHPQISRKKGFEKYLGFTNGKYSFYANESVFYEATSPSGIRKVASPQVMLREASNTLNVTEEIATKIAEELKAYRKRFGDCLPRNAEGNVIKTKKQTDLEKAWKNYQDIGGICLNEQGMPFKDKDEFLAAALPEQKIKWVTEVKKLKIEEFADYAISQMK